MTEKFLEEISVLVAKNQKAQESLTRLEKQGTLQFLCGLLSKIIQDESTFIQNELVKQEEKDKTADDLIERFKEGLSELVHLIVKQTSKSHGPLSENSSKPRRTSKTKSLNPELEKSASEILETSSSKSRLLNVPSSIQRHRSNDRISSSKKRVHTEPAAESRNNSFNYRGGLLQIKTYKKVPYIEEDFYQRLQSKHKMRSRNQNNSFDTSFRLPSIKNSRLKSGKKDISLEYINSEFNYIKGAVSFGNSKRKVFIGRTDIPGPATYKTEACTPRQYRKSPSPIIGKAPKSTWIDAFSRNESPGPGHLYPSKHLVLK